MQLCCQRLLSVESQFATVFHRELCELTPGMELPAPVEGALSGALAHCLLWAALTRDPAEVVEGTVQAFASDHHVRGFPDEAYASLGHALLRSVRAALPAGWSSELSSGWVSYALWLRPHLEAGARLAPGRQERVVSQARLAPPASLEAIFEFLRSQYFPGEHRALKSVCTRVMLRTGADLRAPRPEQSTDPAVIAEVVECLLLMGFAPRPDLAAASPLPVPAVSPAIAAAPGPSADRVVRTQRRFRWSFRRHRDDRTDSAPPWPRMS